MNADHREKLDPDTILVETRMFLCIKRLTRGSPLGIPIKTTLDNPSTVQYAGLIHQLVMKARSTVRDIDPQNDLTFLRVRSKKNEVMIAPGRLSQEGGVFWCHGDVLRSSEFSEECQQRLELLQLIVLRQSHRLEPLSALLEARHQIETFAVMFHSIWTLLLAII